MSSSRVVLPVLRVASPCTADWSAMHGDHRTRFCDHCRKVVHNLSAGTADDAARVLALESACVRFYTRRDGSPFTRPTKPPRGLSRAAIAGAVLIASACAPAPGEHTEPSARTEPIAIEAVPARAPAVEQPAHAAETIVPTCLPSLAEEAAKTASPRKVVAARRVLRMKGKPMQAALGGGIAPSDDPLAGI